MSTPNFSSILDQPVNEIVKPKPMPVGSYIGIVDGIPRFDKSKVQKTDFVEFNIKPMQAQEDVDQTLLGEALNGKALAEKKLRPLAFYLTEDAVYRLDSFLFEHLGIEMGTSRKQAISQAPGKQVGFVIKHEPSQDGTQIYANIASTFKV